MPRTIGVARIFSRRETIVIVLLATAVLAAVTYGVVTYQTPYGCGPNGVATGPGIDWQVLAEPCIYLYFTGIVGASVLLILLIPAPEKNKSLCALRETHRADVVRHSSNFP